LLLQPTHDSFNVVLGLLQKVVVFATAAPIRRLVVVILRAVRLFVSTVLLRLLLRRLLLCTRLVLPAPWDPAQRRPGREEELALRGQAREG
jgi:hypothetical protein